MIASRCLGILLLSVAGSATAEIVLYEHDRYGGRDYQSANSVSNLNDSGFNDEASSVRIRGGQWQICDDAYFKGKCVTLGPGEYPSLRSMGMNDKVSSARSLGWTPDGGGGWNNNSSGGSYNRPTNSNDYDTNRWGAGGNWGYGNRAILYAGYGLNGQTYVVGPDGTSNLDRTGFNDKARSLRIESGYWLFCSDAEFKGNCHTYGPGDYPRLPSGQNHSISSGRQVSNNYPYRNSATWGN